MRLTMLTAMTICGAAAFAAGTPAMAAPGHSEISSQQRTYATTRARSRITVQPRSYLDPGPQVMPYSRTDTDYLFLNRRPTDAMGPGHTNDRKPFPYAWEPGGSWRIP